MLRSFGENLFHRNPHKHRQMVLVTLTAAPCESKTTFGICSITKILFSTHHLLFYQANYVERRKLPSPLTFQILNETKNS